MSAIAVILLIPPFVWHSKTVNIPLITLLVWLFIMDIKIFIDAIIWGGSNFIDRYDGKGYCDVMVKLNVGANVGISSSVAGVMYNLYKILKADTALPGPRSFKKIATDLGISLATPIVVMALNYIVQSRRYVIFQYSGCQNTMQPSWPTVVIYSMWLVIWSLIGVIFSVMIVLTYFQKRKDVRDILRCTNSGLNLARFAKLLIFCSMVVLVMFPLSLYLFTANLTSLSPHFDFSFVHSKAIWGIITYLPLNEPYFICWIYLGLSYMVFIFFGLGTDSIEMYLSWIQAIGLGKVVEWINARRSRDRMTKADKLVSSVLNRANIITTPTAGTEFDVEMQRIIAQESDLDDKSPASTQVSNVFGDKHALSKGSFGEHFNYLGDMGELDEEDIKYINMLYAGDAATTRETDTDVTLSSQNPDANGLHSDGRQYERGAGDEIGYTHRVTHNFI